MKRTTIPIATIAFLLLGGVALQSAAPLLAQTGGPGLGYSVQAGTVAGGGYQLTSLRWHVSGSAVGGSYRLLNLSAAGPWGNCCCTFLPLVRRRW
jgi:hypothetical protein